MPNPKQALTKLFISLNLTPMSKDFQGGAHKMCYYFPLFRSIFLLINHNIIIPNNLFLVLHAHIVWLEWFQKKIINMLKFVIIITQLW